MVLVSGYSGIGKSSVVNELHKVLVQPRVLFASGKFDQHKRDIPYATLAQAFHSVVRSLLALSEAELGLKHAFPGGRAGLVCVELQPFGDKQQVLVVEDNGVGMVPDLDPRSSNLLGLQLVDDLTQQLGGTIMVNRYRGTSFTITFRAERPGERE